MSTKELTKEERQARIDGLCAEYKKTESVELLHELWPLVEKLSYRIINQVIRKIGTDNLANIGVSGDDLKQCGYLALPSTAKYYDPEKGAFGTVLTYSLKDAITKYGFCNSKERAAYKRGDPLLMSSSISLSTPIAPSEDGDDRTLGDTLTDPRAEAAFEAVENADYNESLHSAFVDIIQRLPSRTRPVMLCRLEGMGKLEILTVLGMDDKRYRSLINQISQALYNDKAGLKKLEQYLDGKKQYAKDNGYSLDYITDFYHNCGVERFNNTQTSGVEETVFRREGIRHAADSVKNMSRFGNEAAAFYDCLDE